ncbi:ThiF family adenylyltransferase [Streptomyces sp. NPDC002490]|uniref:ThiF family adenylyltransferase n=1 Tax=Streptomyces sp. NPDC002490 TaxID=3154416 RepID=UPI003330A594
MSTTRSCATSRRPSAAVSPAHPLLKPALRRAWRDLHTVQFGVTPAHAVTLGPLDAATSAFLKLLDGTRGRALLREEAGRVGLSGARADAVVERLAGAGLLDDSTAGGPEVEALRRRTRAVDRLRADHASLTVTAREPGGALGALAARAGARVHVRGAGRTGAVIASLLAAAGVGAVEVRDGGRVEPWEVAPGGHRPDAVGERRDRSVRRLVHEAAPDRAPRARRSLRSAPSAPSTGSTPSTGSAGGPAAERPAGPSEVSAAEPRLALAVLAPRGGLEAYAPDPAAVEDLMAAGVPQLYAGVVEGTAVVGPLVLPGRTACAECLFRSRTDEDPVWPRLLTQWRSGNRPGVAPCEVTLATAVAGFAAGHALALLDGTVPASAGVRWEAALPRLAWCARPLRPHPGCPCGAAGRGADVRYRSE